MTTHVDHLTFLSFSAWMAAHGLAVTIVASAIGSTTRERETTRGYRVTFGRAASRGGFTVIADGEGPTLPEALAQAMTAAQAALKGGR